MKQVMPEKKRKPFHSTINWNEFKELLMLEYGSIQEFEQAVQKQFAHLPQFTTRREIADILYPTIKELITTLDCMFKYHDKSNSETLVLNNNLNQIVANCLPTEFIISYSDQIAEFHDMDPSNLQPSKTFYFNAGFIKKIARGFKANPVDFDRTSNPISMNVNAVHYGNPPPTTHSHTNPNPRSSPNPNYTPPPPLLQTHIPTATPATILTTIPAPTPTTLQPQSAHATSADTKDTTIFTSPWMNNAV